MGNLSSKPELSQPALTSQTDTPIVVTDSRYVLTKPITLSVQHGWQDLHVSDASTSEQYFTCKSSFTVNSCFRSFYDASDVCVLASQPQDTDGKTYKYFIAGDSNAPAAADAYTDRLLFEDILFKCQIKTFSRHFFIFLKGNWRKKHASIYLVPDHIQHLRLSPEIMNMSIRIARVRPAVPLPTKKGHYFIDVAAGVDITMITALCMTLDGRLIATMKQSEMASGSYSHAQGY